MKHDLSTVCLCAAALAFGAAAAGAATVDLKDASGASVGAADLKETPNGVLLRAELTGLPEGVHGFHIHEIGACTPDFDAAGGHFAGGSDAHGFMADGGPHAGDMPNIHVPSSGSLTIEVFNPGLSFTEGDGALFDDDGSALIIHGGEDDYESQPSGDAGDRIACGILEE